MKYVCVFVKEHTLSANLSPTKSNISHKISKLSKLSFINKAWTEFEDFSQLQVSQKYNKYMGKTKKIVDFVVSHTVILK